LPPAFDASVRRAPVRTLPRRLNWYGKKLERCGYPTMKCFEDMFIRFDSSTNATDGQTDRHRMTTQTALA